MKKILLAAGVLSFSAALGQQNDIMDIEKYLEKKNSGEKNDIINPLFRKLKQGQVNMSQNQTGLTLLNPENVYSLPNNDKVYTLPQDNMPCITTELTAFNMPNLASPDSELTALLKPGNTPGKMPNGAQRIIPIPFLVR